MQGVAKWAQVLQLAPDVKTVHAVVRDYVQALGARVEGLPLDCRRNLQDPIDIQAAAVTLLQAELRFDGPQEFRELLHEVAHTFASAAVRITVLDAAPLAAAAD